MVSGERLLAEYWSAPASYRTVIAKHQQDSGIWKFYMNKFSADIARYKEKGSHGKDLWLNPAVWAIACYRFGNWLHTANPFLLVRIPLKAAASTSLTSGEYTSTRRRSSEAIAILPTA